MKLRWLVGIVGPLLPLLYVACSTHDASFDGGTASPDAGDDVDYPDVSQVLPDAGPPDSSTDDGPYCPPAPQGDGGLGVLLAAPFQKDYALYDLGAPPGVPDPLGGCTIDWKDDNTLLIVGHSEDPATAIYSIKIKRDACGHIIGWDGTATQVATAPYADANLVYLGSAVDGGSSGNLLVYSEWPNAGMGQLLPGGTSPARETDLSALGLIAQGSLGGLGVVPAGFTGAGQLRGLTYPVYGSVSEWHHIQIGADGQLVKVGTVTPTLKLCDGCGSGGFAYVPAGSPDFPKESVLVAEWDYANLTRVSGYNVDTNGDPVVATRFDFLTQFKSPYGAYFDRVSGDYVFVQWQFTSENLADHVLVVRGFNKPPPPPPPPN